ncbi:SUMO-targeted ubiquitin-protein ligase subunit Rfp1 [Schizosaccharomyces cryophilus OY26]|uniref:SUMO-targeted ubiquitin-protein ligase subunit Rfp1 n=1 Tax=Schizosaccharomyces cryophilus (strain OY26 / ATCC MYA-4695 / CBS 11777 / NBRC 106824 / NRRL Y48691) TaxID=653667 RepID=S9XDQ6_SCHCR|nr:SUMO-targeted ubiquitin-protein ligase subunit Rfp1 [Schizosaccharomyces cryophilus OY26]EPY51896.1 SUMO-targeted ubiquitin-protein ligase subunit Rfp1 [Schizosaccharomyces cryophilus OY26]
MPLNESIDVNSSDVIDLTRTPSPINEPPQSSAPTVIDVDAIPDDPFTVTPAEERPQRGRSRRRLRRRRNLASNPLSYLEDMVYLGPQVVSRRSSRGSRSLLEIMTRSFPDLGSANAMSPTLFEMLLGRMRYESSHPGRETSASGVNDYFSDYVPETETHSPSIEERKATYVPPKPASQGYTRSFGSETAMACPRCHEELGISKSVEKASVWATKCGHVYCGSCAKVLKTSRRPEAKCSALGCNRYLNTKNAIWELYF